MEVLYNVILLRKNCIYKKCYPWTAFDNQEYFHAEKYNAFLKDIFYYS